MNPRVLFQRPSIMATDSAAPAEIPMNVQHFEIVTKEPAKTQAFLAEQFGWKFDATPHMTPAGEYRAFRFPDSESGGGIVAPMPGQPTGVTPYINVGNLEEKRDACIKAGAEILVPITPVPGMGRFFWFTIHGGPPLACWQPEM